MKPATRGVWVSVWVSSSSSKVFVKAVRDAYLRTGDAIYQAAKKRVRRRFRWRMEKD